MYLLLNKSKKNSHLIVVLIVHIIEI